MAEAFVPYCGAAPVPGAESWNLDPALLTGLAIGLVGGASLIGWSKGRRHDLILFAVGWATLALAFVSPLCNISVALFSARALQHVILHACGGAPPRSRTCRILSGATVRGRPLRHVFRHRLHLLFLVLAQPTPLRRNIREQCRILGDACDHARLSPGAMGCRFPLARPNRLFHRFRDRPADVDVCGADHLRQRAVSTRCMR